MAEEALNEEAAGEDLDAMVASLEDEAGDEAGDLAEALAGGEGDGDDSGGDEKKAAAEEEDNGETIDAAIFEEIGGLRNLDFVLDIPLRVTVELGRTKMSIRELLQLGQGTVIELNKLAGEALEVLVNDKLVARGEVVVVNEKFGIRLTDIISPIERIEQLK